MRQSEHIVYKAAIEVDIRAYAFIDMTLIGDEFDSDVFYFGIELEVLVKPFFFAELLSRPLEQQSSRVGEGIYRVSYSVN